MGSRAKTEKQYQKYEKKRKKELKLLRIKQIYCLASPINPSHAVKSRRSRRPGQLTRNAVIIVENLPVTSRTTITHYPEIATEINLYGVLEIRR